MPKSFAPPPPPPLSNPTQNVLTGNAVAVRRAQVLKSKADRYVQGVFTKAEFVEMFPTITPAKFDKATQGIRPTNPTAKYNDLTWRVGDICIIAPKDAGKITPAEKLALARTKVAEQDHRAKKFKNDVDERKFIPDAEVERFIAYAFKILGRWLDLLPDLFEKKGYLKGSQVTEFIKVLDKVKSQLKADLSNL